MPKNAKSQKVSFVLYIEEVFTSNFKGGITMRLTVKQASDITGLPAQAIRVGMSRGILPWGMAIKNGSRTAYYIESERLEAWLGRKIPTRKEKPVREPLKCIIPDFKFLGFK